MFLIYDLWQESLDEKIHLHQKNGYIDGILVAMIDDNGTCRSMRIVLDGYTDEELKQQYEIAKGNSTAFPMNRKIIDNKLHYNLNVLNGYTEQKVINF